MNEISVTYLAEPSHFGEGHSVVRVETWPGGNTMRTEVARYGEEKIARVAAGILRDLARQEVIAR